MEYQKIVNFLDYETSQPSKNFKTKNWLEISNQSHGKYNTNIQIKFNKAMLKRSLCD